MAIVQVSAVAYGNLMGSTAVHMGLAFAAACMLSIVRGDPGGVRRSSGLAQ